MQNNTSTRIVSWCKYYIIKFAHDFLLVIKSVSIKPSQIYFINILADTLNNTAYLIYILEQEALHSIVLAGFDDAFCDLLLQF